MLVFLWDRIGILSLVRGQDSNPVPQAAPPGAGGNYELSFIKARREPGGAGTGVADTSRGRACPRVRDPPPPAGTIGPEAGCATETSRTAPGACPRVRVGRSALGRLPPRDAPLRSSLRRRRRLERKRCGCAKLAGAMQPIQRPRHVSCARALPGRL